MTTTSIVDHQFLVRTLCGRYSWPTLAEGGHWAMEVVIGEQSTLHPIGRPQFTSLAPGFSWRADTLPELVWPGHHDCVIHIWVAHDKNFTEDSITAAVAHINIPAASTDPASTASVTWPDPLTMWVDGSGL